MVQSRCEIETYEVEFKWEITQFSKVKTLVESRLTKIPSVTIQSNNFSSKLTNMKATPWYLEFVYTIYDSYKIILKTIFGSAIFTVQFFVLNNEQKKEKLNDITNLCVGKYGEKYTLPVASKYLNNEKYIFNDTLTIICNVTEYGKPIINPFPSLKDYCYSLSTDINNLLTSEQYSDVTLIVNGTEFKVHKMILSARSPVFAAMFSQTDMKETQIHQVVIKNTNAEAVKKFLEFIYSDKIKQLDKERFDVWILADEYQIETLKKYCEHCIYDCLNEECILEIIKFADLYNIQKLFDKALGFFVTHCKSMLKNDEWKSLAKTNPNLVVLTLDRLAQEY